METNLRNVWISKRASIIREHRTISEATKREVTGCAVGGDGEGGGR
jgi:hypothetical protein